MVSVASALLVGHISSPSNSQHHITKLLLGRVPSFENRELPKTTNGNEEIFDIDGNTSYPKQKLKSILLWGPQNSFQNYKQSKICENTGVFVD